MKHLIPLLAVLLSGCNFHPQPKPSIALSTSPDSLWIVLAPTDPPTYSDTNPSILQHERKYLILRDEGNFSVYTQGNEMPIQGQSTPTTIESMYLIQDWKLRAKAEAKHKYTNRDIYREYLVRISYDGIWGKDLYIAGNPQFSNSFAALSHY